MIIESGNKPGREYYEEVVNLQCQYKRILKKPGKKILNTKKICIVNLVIIGVFLFLCLIALVNGYHFIPFEIIMITLIVCLGALFILNIVRINGAVKKYMETKGHVVYEIDEQQIQYDNDMVVYKMPWDNVLEVRILKNSVNVIGKEVQPLIISFTKDKGEIFLNFVKENKLQIPVL